MKAWGRDKVVPCLTWDCRWRPPGMFMQFAIAGNPKVSSHEMKCRPVAVMHFRTRHGSEIRTAMNGRYSQYSPILSKAATPVVRGSRENPRTWSKLELKTGVRSFAPAKSQPAHVQASLAKRAAVEFVATAVLLAAIAGSGIMGERLAAGNVAVALLANSIATGAVLIALILTFGELSGAHINPAVTLSLAVRNAFSWRETPAYIAAQLVGAFSGVALANGMF